MNFVSLFSGIGAFDLGLERAGMTCVAQVEIDPWCRAVLEKHWPHVPKFGDVKQFSRRDINYGTVDVVAGGFPCQPISCAGKRDGESDERWLWPEMLRIIDTLGPTWIVAENVPGLRNLGFDTVAEGLEANDYTVWPLVVGADDVGAPHRRKRAWIVAHRPHNWIGRREQQPECGEESRSMANGTGDGRRTRPGVSLATTIENADGSELAGVGCLEHAAIEGLEGWRKRLSGQAGRWPAGPGEQHEWEPPRTQSRLGGNPHGPANRLDGFRRRNRLKALGNALIWQIPYLIGRWIMQYEKQEQGA